MPCVAENKNRFQKYTVKIDGEEIVTGILMQTWKKREICPGRDMYP